MRTTDCTPHLLLISCQLLMHRIFLLPLQKKSTSYESHRFTEWIRLEGATEDHQIQAPCLSRVIPEPIAQDCVQMALEYLQSDRIHNLLDSLFPCSVNCTVKMFLLMFRWNFLSFRFCPLPLVPLLATPSRTWCILLTPFHQRLKNIDEVPSQSYFSEQAQLPQLSL